MGKYFVNTGGNDMAKYVMALDAGTTTTDVFYLTKKERLSVGAEGVYSIFSETGLGGA